MRRLLLRKKRTWVLFCTPFLLVGGVTTFRIFDRERELFVHEMHSTVEKRLSEASGFRVRLGKLGIGIFQETVLENLSFSLPEEKPFLIFPSARFQKEEKITQVKFEKGKLSWGGIALGNLGGRILIGRASPSLGPAASLQKAFVEGEFRRGGWLKISLERVNPLVFKGKVVLQNFRWGERRLSGMGDMVFLVRDSQKPWKNLKLKTSWHHLTLDEEPMETIAGGFSVSERTLLADRLRWGDMFSFSGKVTMTPPYPAEGRLRFQRIGRETIRRFLNKEYSGTPPESMEGQIFLNGPLQKIHLRGNLIAYKGKVKETDYEKIISSFYGHWPVVTVESRIEREFPKESSATVRGLVDLGELGKKGFYKTVALEGTDAMVWKGLVFQSPSEETLVFGKENRNTSITFTTFLNQALPQEKEKEEFELEYKLRNDKSLKMRFKGDEEFLGLERKTSF